ncbi:MAG: carboxypeptidase-like regulatory domain-containing protein, partial [Bacteroidia bacterium]
MIRSITVLLFLCTFLQLQLKANPGGATLTGKITNKTDNTPLPSAVIYFPDLKSGASTDLDGQYKITNLPEGS